MKQIELDDTLRAKLRERAPDVDPTKIAVFRAAALSTAPIRKRHPLYNGAVVTEALLGEMRDELHKESRPLQIMHGSSDGDQLPIGRVFDAELSQGTGPNGATELRTLFWIDTEHLELVNKVNSGTIDQVSVAFLSKSIKSSKTGFDFLGPKASFENVWGGVDDQGNKMGTDGAHAILDGLDGWYEMSLVGQGGALGAKILSGGQLHLSASNQDVSPLVLQLSSGTSPTPPKPEPKKDTFDMDAKEFAALIAENAAKLANAERDRDVAKAEVTTLTAQVTTLTAEVATLKGTDDAKKVTELTSANADLQTRLDAAVALPGKLLAPLFAMTGQTTATLDNDEAKALDQVKGLGDSLKALGAQLVGGARAGLSLVNGGGGGAPRGNDAFKSRRA